VVWIKQLEAEECENALDTETAAINKIAVEQIRIGFGWKSILIKDIHQIIELTVNITAHCEFSFIGNFHVDKRWLFTEEGIHVVEYLELDVKVELSDYWTLKDL
jgi:hypothetical protein